MAALAGAVTTTDAARSGNTRKPRRYALTPCPAAHTPLCVCLRFIVSPCLMHNIPERSAAPAPDPPLDLTAIL